MVRKCIAVGIFVCLTVVTLSGVDACFRRRCRPTCCPSTYVVDTCVTVPTATDPMSGGGPSTSEPGTSTAPTAAEMKMWQFMVENGYEQKDFDLLWKNSTPEKRKMDYDGLKKIVDDATEKAEKEQKQKDEKENKKKKDTETSAPASIQVILPADARLFFDGAPTRTTGTERFFTTPNLEPSAAYTYTLRAEFSRGGQVQIETRSISVHAGRTMSVTFADVGGGSSVALRSGN